MYGVKFVGHFNNHFDLLKQSKEEKSPVTARKMTTSPWHTPSSPALPSKDMHTLQ